jgi:GNAT superfamily N-acetyltransferase
MKEDAHNKTDYERALEVYNSLSPQQKLFVAPKGRFVDSPSLVYRHLAPKDTGFVEMYKFHPDKDEAFITLAVRPDNQGKGIGKYLIQKAIEEAKAREDINSVIYRADNANTVSDKLGAKTGKLKKKTPDFTEYKIDTETQYKVSPEKLAIIKRVIDAYREKYNTDLSYMQFEDSPVAYFNNGIATDY